MSRLTPEGELRVLELRGKAEFSTDKMMEDWDENSDVTADEMLGITAQGIEQEYWDVSPPIMEAMKLMAALTILLIEERRKK